MKTNTPALGHFSIIALAAIIAAATPSNAALTILPGWDLLWTQPGTTFLGAPFTGVPLGTYDFGGTIGVQSVGNADTIVERISPSTIPAPGTAPPISIELVQLQLVSVAPVDLGAGLGLYYVTLQSNRGGGDPPAGPASTGEMTITFDPEPPQPTDPHGTFDSFFDVYFDVRLGGLNGPIVASQTLLLSSSGTDWVHGPPPGATLIDDVNSKLNGTDITNDFWPGPIIESHPSGAVHKAISAIPETTTLVPLAAFCAAGLWIRRRPTLVCRWQCHGS